MENVDCKEYLKEINDVVGQKLSNFNNMFRKVLDGKKYDDKLWRKCKLNGDDVSLCKDLGDYIKEPNKFKELDKIIDDECEKKREDNQHN